MELLPSLLVFFLLHVPLACPAPSGIRATLTHVDSNGDFTASELYRRAMRRSQHRMDALGEMLTVSGVDARATVHDGLGEYMMDLAVGTPALPFSAIMDTGSNLVWAQCQPCVECLPHSALQYDPSNSSTYSASPCTDSYCKALPSTCTTACEYHYDYMDSSWTDGVLSTETFTFGSGDPIPNVTFGCGYNNSFNTPFYASGLVGLGPGSLSLVSQLGFGKFSYCLTSVDDLSSTGTLLLGSFADLKEPTSAIRSTPLVADSFYFLDLRGISVGATLLPIPSDTFANKILIDSGTTFTVLPPAALDLVKQELRSVVDLPPANDIPWFDPCFRLKSSEVPQLPDMTFHFSGADMVLPMRNYMLVDTEAGVMCLAMNPSSVPMSIFGNFQQQDMHILYDVAGKSLSFAPAQCDKL
ncbi:aspartic proteinase [Musa troglodytarum]|uniref:Aspartic proteinase n=4 Tax=Musa troglodytarum TaxID=320322 RepID=A0A9E7L3J5_9LILI|nr:aspartic proteinase [Musa troglodytarum]